MGVEKMKLDKRKEEVLREAVTRLKVAGASVYNSASGTKPFRASKFLNVLGKEIQQLATELSVFLGEVEIERLSWELEKQPSLHILKVLVKEQ